MNSPRTFAAALSRAAGRPAGFDYLRLTLAVAIIGFHSIVTCYGSAVQNRILASGLGWPFNLVLPMFFSLSGFLVAGSLVRNEGLGRFLWLRISRIYPALIFDTVVCALILGPLTTTLTLRDYFASPALWAYGRNALGLIHFYLPGVFESNPISKVNAQLWTIPVELECYVLLVFLAIIRLARAPRVFAGVCLALSVAAAGWQAVNMPHDVARGLVPGSALVLCFLSGVALFLCRARVPFMPTYFIAAAALFAACVYESRWIHLAALPAAYVTCYIGCQNLPRTRFIQRFDVSYGLYLFGYPVQQALVLLSGGAAAWYWNIALALPLTFSVACLSLFAVERPSHAWLTRLRMPGTLRRT